MTRTNHQEKTWESYFVMYLADVSNEKKKGIVYGFSLANMEALITHCVWGEAMAARNGGVRK